MSHLLQILIMVNLVTCGTEIEQKCKICTWVIDLMILIAIKIHNPLGINMLLIYCRVCAYPAKYPHFPDILYLIFPYISNISLFPYISLFQISNISLYLISCIILFPISCISLFPISCISLFPISNILYQSISNILYQFICNLRMLNTNQLSDIVLLSYTTEMFCFHMCIVVLVC